MASFDEWVATVPDSITRDPLPEERTRNLAEERVEYELDLSHLLDNPPLP